VIALPFPCSHIINDGVAPDVVQSVLLFDLEPTFANYHTNFSFVVNGVCEPRMGENWLSMSNNACGTLSKNYRMCWLVCLVGRVLDTGEVSIVLFRSVLGVKGAE
jgi:hypothetical protein